jgi:hypothetical protein
MINVAEQFHLAFYGLMKLIKLLQIQKVGDSGTSNRVLATFISWLSENKTVLLFQLQIILTYYH